MKEKNFQPAIIALIAVIVIVAVVLSLAFSQGGFSLSGSVAVVKLEGEISTENQAFTSSANAFDIVKQLASAEKDPSVKSILLEINSPGGSIVASNQIAEKIKSMKKPVVSWISDIGASGAYEVAASTDFIIADPDSLTGSIGVIAILPDYQGLLEKIGVKFRIFKEGELKDLGSPFREFTEEEKIVFQNLLSEAFASFKSKVLEFRKGKLDIQAFEKIADGRILNGRQAKEIGLIDGLGSREQALVKAGELGGIKGIPAEKNFSAKEISIADVFSRIGYSFGSGFKSGIQNSVPSIKS